MKTRVQLIIGSDSRGSSDEVFAQRGDESFIEFADRIDTVLRVRLGLLEGENHSFVERQIEAGRKDVAQRAMNIVGVAQHSMFLAGAEWAGNLLHKVIDEIRALTDGSSSNHKEPK